MRANPAGPRSSAVPLAALFVYGAGPVPALGVVGCGVSTAIVMWLLALAAWQVMRRDPFYRPFAIFGHGLRPPHRPALAAQLRLGVPMGLGIGVEVGSNVGLIDDGQIATGGKFWSARYGTVLASNSANITVLTSQSSYPNLAPGSTFTILNKAGSATTATMPDTISLLGIEIFNWQLILIIIGLPGLLAALLFLLVREPPRRSPPDSARLVPADAPLGRKLMAFTGLDAVKAINMRGATYWPLFAALALSAIESQGLPAWRVPFITRTHGWTEAEIGNLLGPLLFAASIIGIVLGGVFVSWMNRRYKDGNIRACALVFTGTTIFAIATPLMPSGELALGCMAMTSIFGLAGAPAQNAAIQRIAPNEMRGQVTALYLFMFTFFGAMGSFVIGSVSTYVVGDPAKPFLCWDPRQFDSYVDPTPTDFK